MYTAGIDIGSATSKAVILHGDQMVAYHLVATGPESQACAQEVMAGVISKAGLRGSQIENVVATGYGRINVSFASKIVSEIACHAKGVNFLFPRSRTILDMGGQDCKAIRINASGDHVHFVMNDKCAAGTGRFLEVIAELLKIPLAEIGPLSLQAKNNINISNICTVFARSEVSRHLRQGISKADILGGVLAAQAERTFGLLRRVGIEEDFVISGGIAKNIGVVKRLEEKIGFPAFISEEPQIIGAIGAAIFAKRNN